MCPNIRCDIFFSFTEFTDKDLNRVLVIYYIKYLTLEVDIRIEKCTTFLYLLTYPPTTTGQDIGATAYGTGCSIRIYLSQ